MSLQVLAPGPLTTVQDLGRPGHRHLGVPLAGALDPGAAILGNRLVGNPDGAAVLEFTLSGPRLAFDRPLRIALTGGDIEATFVAAAGPSIDIPGGRPVELPPGELQLGRLRTGARGWLAVAGGIDVPRVLCSRSTDLRGDFGGFEGRALRRGDVLALVDPPVMPVDTPRVPRWWISPDALDPPDTPIRFVPASGVDAALKHRLGGTYWEVGPDSNRQGIRLVGDPIAAPDAQQLSAPVAPGTVQLPPDGQPIILLADAQTVGGYLRLGHVAAADLPRLAQARPGTPLRLVPCDAVHAQRLMAAARARLARISLALETRP